MAGRDLQVVADVILEHPGQLGLLHHHVPVPVAAPRLPASAGTLTGSMSGWLELFQFPLDSQNAERSRTATLMW